MITLLNNPKWFSRYYLDNKKWPINLIYNPKLQKGKSCLILKTKWDSEDLEDIYGIIMDFIVDFALSKAYKSFEYGNIIIKSDELKIYYQ